MPINSFDDVPVRPANLSDPAPVFPWPEGNRAALCLSFDVDSESAFTGYNPANAERLVTMSYGGYEPRVGVPKVLELLDELGLKATFFIAGWAVDAHPAMAESILKAGHEIGHHGYHHRPPEPGADWMEEDIARGYETLQRRLGVRPVGYRSPFGDFTEEMRVLLAKEGMLYTSSWRDDVRPYRHRLNDGSRGTIEIPATAGFDDWAYGLSTRINPRSVFPKEHVLAIWREDLDELREWGGMVTTIFHPVVSGRPARYRQLRDFLTYAMEAGDVWMATGEQVARHFEKHEAAAQSAAQGKAG